MTLPVPLCTTTSLSSFVRPLRADGAPVDAAPRRARLPVSFEESPGAWIPYLRFRSFVSDLVAREGAVDLGSRAALVGGERSLDPSVRSALLGAPTLFNALQAVTQICTSQSTHLNIWLEPRGATVRVCHVNAVGPRVAGYDILESHTTTCLVSIARAYLGEQWLPSRITLRREATTASAWPAGGLYAGLRGPRFSWDEYGGIEIPVDMVWTPNPRARLTDSGEDHRGVPSSFAATLRALLTTYVPEGRPSARFAAELVGISVRSLQRRLARAGTSFREVLELASFDAVCIVLADEHVPLTEVALLLGYSEQSSFSRAFRSWTGLTPRDFRHRALRDRGGRPPGLPH